jgi:hypothetical protein
MLNFPETTNLEIHTVYCDSAFARKANSSCYFAFLGSRGITVYSRETLRLFFSLFSKKVSVASQETGSRIVEKGDFRNYDRILRSRMKIDTSLVKDFSRYTKSSFLNKQKRKQQHKIICEQMQYVLGMHFCFQ